MSAQSSHRSKKYLQNFGALTRKGKQGLPVTVKECWAVSVMFENTGRPILARSEHGQLYRGGKMIGMPSASHL